jgi:uncharacterized protein
VAVLAACTTSTAGGGQSPQHLSTPPPSATQSAPSAPSSPPAAPSSAPPLAPLCPEATSTAALTACLADTIGTYWSGQLNKAVAEPVVLHPEADKVPAPCRAGLRIAPAFTCPGDRTLYFTDAFVAKLDATFTGALRTYAFAVVQAHEMGHVVQLEVRQPQIEENHPSATVTRFVEQQADCLSGVWAHVATTEIGLDPAQFRSVALQVLTSISSDKEIATHGTPEQRLAAVDRGLNGGRPQSCSLATFH